MPKVKAKPSNPPLQQEERIDLLERRIDKELGEIKELLQGMMYSRMAIKESSEESEDIEETSDLEENEEVKDAPVQRPVHTHYLAKTLEPSVPSFMNTTIPIALGTPTVKRSSVDENKREWMEDATGYSTSAWKPTTPRRLSLAPQLRLNPLAENTHVNVTMVPFSKLLSNGLPGKIVEFKKEVQKHMDMYGYKIQAAVYVTDELKRKIANKCRVKGITEDTFNLLDNEKLFDLLDTYCTADSMVEWIEMFRKSVKFEDANKLNAITSTRLGSLYDAVTNFTLLFMQVYNAMLPEDDQTTDRIVPSFHGGTKLPGEQENTSLINLYLGSMPNDIGYVLHKSFYPQGPKKAKLHDIGTYTDDFMTKLFGLTQAGIHLRPLEDHFNDIRKRPSEDTKPGFKERTKYSTLVNQNRPFFRGKTSSETSLNYLAPQGAEFDFSDNDNFDESINNCESEPMEDEVDPNNYQLAMVSGSSPPPVCFQYAWTQIQCKKTGCTYLHTPESARAALKKRVDAWDGIIAKGKSETTTSSTRNIHRPQVFHMVCPLLATSSGNRNDLLTAVHTKVVLFADEPITAVALCDSGASADNYMTEKYFSENIRALQEYCVPIDDFVVLADGITVCPIKSRVSLPVKFEIEGRSTIVNLDFKVFGSSSPAQDIIIGLVSLIGSCFYIYVDLLGKAHADFVHNGPAVENGSLSTLLEPFSKVREVAEEESSTPLPVNFSEYLHYLGKPHSEAQQEYESLFDSHCSAKMMEITNLRTLLLTKGSKVFIPKNWNGIKDVVVNLTWKTPPPRRKPTAANVNPKILETAETEFRRLCEYMYRPSTSDVVSPLVIAPKATYPFVRFCGNYIAINKYLEIGHSPIPNVFHSLEKISKFKVFIDLDLSNSFHQFRLSPESSSRLSIQTPWGQVEPIFMPEGIGPATGILQSHMQRIFAKFTDWCLVLFDNVLLLADTYQDAYSKLESFLDVCIDNNVVLKFAKSWIGYDEAKFFGYKCEHLRYGMDNERIQAVLDLKMPDNRRAMQSFLGTLVFFKPFTPAFATIAVPLYNATTDDFDWNDKVEVAKLVPHFEKLKNASMNCLQLYYPDYRLKWFLRCDASDVGCGAVLFQVTDENVIQPLVFLSHKFTDAATRWTVIERECYALYWAVFKNDYYLRCKEFVLQTDHRNLVYMETSNTPKVIRWFIHLQSYVFLVEHIPGVNNKVADLLSRLHKVSTLSNSEMLGLAHGGRSGHFGIHRTHKIVKLLFPASEVTVEDARACVLNCAVCQKFRSLGQASLPPIHKSFAPEHHRAVVACDTLEVHKDNYGNCYLIVVVNLFTRFVHLFPTAAKDASTVATCLFQYFSYYGLADIFLTDPGSEFCNRVMSSLLKWLGPVHKVGLVNNPQQDGVEHVNREILRHLRTITADERIIDKWSDPTVLPWVQIQLNSSVHSATGCSPYILQYGSLDHSYFTFPLSTPEEADDYLAKLSGNLELVRSAASTKQRSTDAKFQSKTNPTAYTRYQPGNWVFHVLKDQMSVGHKLKARKRGPYEVIHHEGNTVRVKDLVNDTQRDLHQQDVVMFHGEKEEAKAMANLDDDQFAVRCIKGYYGDPEKRSTLSFLVLFEDGEEKWLPYTADIASTAAFENFCSVRKALSIVLLSTSQVTALRRDILKKSVDTLLLGKTVFLNLRIWGGEWYASLKDNLPESHNHNYWIAAKVKSVVVRKKEYVLFVPAMKVSFTVNNWFMHCHAGDANTKSDDANTVVDAEYLREHDVHL